MKHAPSIVSSLLAAALALGCANDNSGDHNPAPTTSTTAVHSSSSATSAATTTTAATMTTTSPTGSASGASTGESCAFLSCTDDPEPGCDDWAQDCREGQKCVAVITDGTAWDALRCVDVSGTDEPGDPCTSEGAASGLDSCVKGAMCWDVNAEGVGYCVAQCTGSAEAPICPGMGSCTITTTGVLNLCLSGCAPLLQDCDPTEACYAINSIFICAQDASGDEGQANDPCAVINACDPGLICMDAGLVGVGCAQAPAGCCTPFCTFPGGTCPNPDQQCVQFFDPMTLSPGDPRLDIGYCGVAV